MNASAILPFFCNSYDIPSTPTTSQRIQDQILYVLQPFHWCSWSCVHTPRLWRKSVLALRLHSIIQSTDKAVPKGTDRKATQILIQPWYRIVNIFKNSWKPQNITAIPQTNMRRNSSLKVEKHLRRKSTEMHNKNPNCF